MKKWRILAASLAAAGMLSGCTTIRELPREARQSEPQGAEYDLCRTLLMAFLRNDAKTFVAGEIQRKIVCRQQKGDHRLHGRTDLLPICDRAGTDRVHAARLEDPVPADR